MITVTTSAAQQIRIAATQSDADEMGLRIAARRDDDGSLHYAMGFDEARNDDLVVTSEGIALVVSPADTGLLDGMTLDYVEFDADELVKKLRSDVEVAVRAGRLDYEEAGRLLRFYEDGLAGYTYLEEQV